MSKRYAIVPVEPTEDMKRKGIDAAPMTLIEQQPVGRRMRAGWNTDECGEVFSAMLSAAPEPDDALVDRVARAMYGSEFSVDDFDEADASDRQKQRWISRARAAIAAIREAD